MIEVQLTNDKEISAYQVFVISQDGILDSATCEYGRDDQGAMFAQAYKTAHLWAAEYVAKVVTNWR